MSEDESTLLRACLAYPFDIGPRGAYADYLMEYGEDDWARERGEFINWHIQISQSPYRKSMGKEYSDWAEKIWYLFEGRVPLLRFHRNQFAKLGHTFVVPIHRSGGYAKGGAVVIRNGMPELVTMTCEQFLGPPRGTTNCKVCRGTGLVEMLEDRPFMPMIDNDGLLPDLVFSRLTVPCEHCGDGYAIDMVKRWPITEVEFTGTADRARDCARRGWLFGEEYVSEVEVMTHASGGAEPEFSDWVRRRFGQAAVNGMRGWHGLPRLAWPEPKKSKYLQDAIDSIDVGNLVQATLADALRTAGRPAEPPSSSRR